MSLGAREAQYVVARRFPDVFARRRQNGGKQLESDWNVRVPVFRKITYIG
jgi:hypothetical protein